MFAKENYIDLFDKIHSLLTRKSTVLIAIEGNSGAGKSTFAKFIGQNFDCNIFHMDDFFLTPELRTPERLNEVGGNVDYERFKKEVLDRIPIGDNFIYRKFNCQTSEFNEVFVKHKQLNIVEGCYSLHPLLIDDYDLKIFIQVDPNTQIERILRRNGEYMLKRFINEWIPKENEYFEVMKIKDKCDIIYHT